jgi:cytochrome c
VRTLAAAALLLAAPAAADPAGEGFALYQRHCRTCHTLAAGDHRLGPSLHGIVGRPAGAAEGFAYSSALRVGALVWTEAALDAFLADPAGFLPGNGMVYPGMPSAEARAAVIAYLADPQRE